MNLPRPQRRRAVAAGSVATLLVLAAACTGGSEDEESLPERSLGAAPTLEARPIPMDVEVNRVVDGRLRPPDRGRVARRAGKVIDGYFEAAYLGDYPRRAFPGAFEGFTAGAAAEARGDRALMTNLRTGPDTEAVAARVKRARLDVLYHRKNLIGLTARVRLVFLQERADAPDVTVTVRGRLLMQRREGRWQVFGYDMTRSATRTKGAGS